MIRLLFVAGLFALIATCVVLLKRTVPFEIQTLLAKDHPRRIQYERDLESFNDEGVVWLLVRRDTPFEPKTLHSLSEQIAGHLEMDDVFDTVIGPHNAKFIEIDEEGFRLVPFIENGEWTARAKEKLATEIWQNSLFRDDGRAFLVSFDFRKTVSRHAEKPAVDRLETYLTQLRAENPGIETFLLGAKVASASFLTEVRFQQAVITPLLLLALTIFLFLCYRSWQIVIWNFFVMFVCYAATLCLIILVEGGLGPYSSFALMFAFIVATTDLIHFFGRFQQVDGTVAERLARTRTIAYVPCLLTSLTTAFGFLALVVNQNLPIRYFGIYCAFSCMLEWVIIFYLLPTLLPAFGFNPGQKRWQMPELAKKIAPFVNRYATLIVAVSLFLLVVFTASSLRIVIDDNFYTKFVSDHPLSHSIDSFSKEFNFVGSIDVVVEKSAYHFESRETQDALRNFEHELAAHPGVSKITSFRQVEDELDFELARANSNPEHRLETRKSIMSMLIDYGGVQDLKNESKQEIRTIVFLKSLATADLDSVLGTIDELAKTYDTQFKIRPAGFSVIRSFINSRVIRDFFESFLLSFALIYLCYWWLFRNLKWSFIALVPNILPLIAISGLMGIFRVPVDTNLVILVCVVFGIAGDNTVHLTYVLQQERATGLSYGEALERAWRLIGIAMIGTAGAFLFCLPVFLLGSLKLFTHITIFLSIAFLAAFFADTIAFPAFQVKFGWSKEK